MLRVLVFIQHVLQHSVHEEPGTNFAGFFWVSQWPAFFLGCGIVLLIPLAQRHIGLAKLAFGCALVLLPFAVYLAPSFRVADPIFATLALGAAFFCQFGSLKGVC